MDRGTCPTCDGGVGGWQERARKLQDRAHLLKVTGTIDILPSSIVEWVVLTHKGKAANVVRHPWWVYQAHGCCNESDSMIILYY